MRGAERTVVGCAHDTSVAGGCDNGALIEFLIITGRSGAGRSTAADTLEDLGWSVIDNLPAAVMPKVAELVQRPGSEVERVAFVVGRGAYQDDFTQAVERLRFSGHHVRVLFLDATDEVLVRRYEGTRRRHPVDGTTVTDAIAQEAELLSHVKAQADIVIDTSELNVHQLHDRVLDLFGGRDPSAPLQLTVMSFGYKHGIPLDADLVLDCRFLPNPFFVEELRHRLGTDQAVADYVLNREETRELLERITALLDFTLPRYQREGKSYLTIALGCTGGRHRSIVLVEELRRLLDARGYRVLVRHRDVER